MDTAFGAAFPQGTFAVFGLRPIMPPQFDAHPQESWGVPWPVHWSGAMLPLAQSRASGFAKQPVGPQDAGTLKDVPLPPATHA
jgi:hypothetical protein